MHGAQQHPDRLQAVGHHERYGVARLRAVLPQHGGHGAAAARQVGIGEWRTVLRRERVHRLRPARSLLLDQRMDGGSVDAHAAPCLASRRKSFLARYPFGVGRVAVESWITTDRAKELVYLPSGQDFDASEESGRQKDFKPVALNAKANMSVKNELREINSANVVGKLEGSDATLKNEYVIYTAHWDHLGRDPKLPGDQIFNGALDNASGTAALLEIAEAFTKLATPPKRSILFLAVTAEEKGLLGAKYYAENPLYPLNKTLANINMDGVNQWGRTKDITMVGDDNSSLVDLLRETATAQGRAVNPDPEPEKGFYYRSDHFEFAKQGVPALYTDSGTDYVGKDAAYSKQKRDEYTEKDYHKVSDEIKPDWDLAGAVDDAQLLTTIGYRVAQGEKFPEWKAGTEFKAKRDEMMKRCRPRPSPKQPMPQIAPITQIQARCSNTVLG